MIQPRPAHPSFRGGSPAGWWHINKQTGEISCCMRVEGGTSMSDIWPCILVLPLQWLTVSGTRTPSTSALQVPRFSLAQLQKSSATKSNKQQTTKANGMKLLITLEWFLLWRELEFWKLGREPWRRGSVVTWNECFYCNSRSQSYFWSLFVFSGPLLKRSNPGPREADGLWYLHHHRGLTTVINVPVRSCSIQVFTFCCWCQIIKSLTGHIFTRSSSSLWMT